MSSTTNTEAALVLVAEDDKKTSQLLTTYLQREGFRTLAALQGREALALFEREKPRLVILDVMLPQLDGWEVCRSIRKTSEIPILFLTARDEEADRILGLGLGGDDYVVKPFSPREVVARVKAILRRSEKRNTETPRQLQHDGLLLDLDKRRVTLHGETVSLTPTEYALLTALMTSPGRVFVRDELLDKLYPSGETVVDRVVDVHIGKLRQKIEIDAAAPLMILTVRGLGYRFADPLE
jgi:DNA-binding response OmpR family regulator